MAPHARRAPGLAGPSRAAGPPHPAPACEGRPRAAGGGRAFHSPAPAAAAEAHGPWSGQARARGMRRHVGTGRPGTPGTSAASGTGTGTRFGPLAPPEDPQRLVVAWRGGSPGPLSPTGKRPAERVRGSLPSTAVAVRRLPFDSGPPGRRGLAPRRPGVAAWRPACARHGSRAANPGEGAPTLVSPSPTKGARRPSSREGGSQTSSLKHAGTPTSPQVRHYQRRRVRTPGSVPAPLARPGKWSTGVIQLIH